MRFLIFVFVICTVNGSLTYPYDPYYQQDSDPLQYSNPTAYKIGSGVVPSSSYSSFNYLNPSDPYYQPFKLWNSNPTYQIGQGVLSSSSSSDTQSPYNPYYPYFSYNWNTFNTDYYNPYNNNN